MKTMIALLNDAGAFVPQQTTKRVIRGLQNTFPLYALALLKGGIR